MAPDASVYRSLRNIRIRHFLESLRERSRRLRQNTLVTSGLLGVVLLPFLMLAFMPANILLQRDSIQDGFGSAVLIQFLSWFIFLSQRDALAHRRGEYYLASWPVSTATRNRVNLMIVLLANHLLWLITIPSLAWFLVMHVAGNEQWLTKAVASLKLLVVLHFTIILQIRYLEHWSIPWLKLLVANLWLFLTLALVKLLDNPLAVCALLALPFIMRNLPELPAGHASRLANKASTTLRAQMTRLSPWHALFVLMLSTDQGQPHRWRILVSALTAGTSGFLISGLSSPYLFLALTVIICAVIYTINSLYYYFNECHQESRMLLESWGMSASRLGRRNQELFLVADILLIAPVLAHALIRGYINSGQALFAGLCTLIYIPLIFFISVRARENVLAYSMLAFVPAWLGALMIT